MKENASCEVGKDGLSPPRVVWRAERILATVWHFRRLFLQTWLPRPTPTAQSWSVNKKSSYYNVCTLHFSSFEKTVLLSWGWTPEQWFEVISWGDEGRMEKLYRSSPCPLGKITSKLYLQNNRCIHLVFKDPLISVLVDCSVEVFLSI